MEIHNKKGMNLISLVIILAIIALIAGIAIKFAIGDNGVVSNAIKMDIDTAQGEVRDHLLVCLNEELSCASAKVSGTTTDIATIYNEPALINYLMGNQNFKDEERSDTGAIKCIEEFKDLEKNNVAIINDVKNRKEGVDLEVKTKYRVISTELCSDGNRYGTGKNIKDGNIFTLEAVVESEVDGKIVYEDYSEENKDKYQGKFQLKYYDKSGKVKVLETVSLYVANQS